MSTAIAEKKNESNGEKYGLLRVVMERDFDSFGIKERDKFLDDLAELLALDRNQLHSATFDRGCVHAKIKIPEADLDAFLGLYQRALKRGDSETIARIRAFLAEHSVANVTGEFTVPLQIRMAKPVIDAAPGSQEIILVHGFNGDNATFGSLPKYLSDSFYCPVTPFEYPTNWRKHSPSIYFLAKSFDRWFRNTVQSQRVAIIAHSMGGILVRKFLTIQTYHPRPVDGYVKQVSFIASPFDGSPLASFAASLGLGGAQLDELSTTSAFIAELKEAWLSWTAVHVPHDCQITSLHGTADKVVSAVNAMGTTRGAETIDNEDHTSIVKPNSVGSQVVKTLKRYLEDADFIQTEATDPNSTRATQP